MRCFAHRATCHSTCTGKWHTFIWQRLSPRSCLARANSRPLIAVKRGLMREQTIRVSIAAVALSIASTTALAQTDPGPRGGAANAGAPIASLTLKEGKFFASGQEAFTEEASATGAVADTEPGLGPRFNLTSCGGCHAHPAVGGSSPPDNPQVNAASADQVALVTSLGIIAANGPIREVRFTDDGGVHDLFTIAGLPGAPSACNIPQPDFTSAKAA